MEIVVEQVDVFTEVPFAGNPAAVVLGNPDLDDSLMQAIAREMNLSETAFVGEPNGEGEIPVRFFTPRQEVPLCGHATLAAHYVRARERGESTGSTTQVSPGGRWDVSWEARAAGVFVTMIATSHRAREHLDRRPPRRPAGRPRDPGDRSRPRVAGPGPVDGPRQAHRAAAGPGDPLRTVPRLRRAEHPVDPPWGLAATCPSP